MDWAARLNQLFGSFGILTFQYSQHKDRFETKPDGQDVPRIDDTTASPTVVLGGFGSVNGTTQNNRSTRDLYSGSFTGYVGANEFKVGGDYSNDDTSGSTYYTGGQRLVIRACGTGANTCDLARAPFYTNSQGRRTQVYYEHRIYTANASDLTPLVANTFDTPSKRWGAFVQDQWRILPTLTVNAGLRWDQEHYFGDAAQRAQIGLDATAFKLLNQWAPRFGFVWDFVGDGTSKFYGSAGRFYYAIPTDLNIRVFTGQTAVFNYNYSTTDFATQDFGGRARQSRSAPPRASRWTPERRLKLRMSTPWASRRPSIRLSRSA